jgi:hypothetical protein
MSKPERSKSRFRPIPVVLLLCACQAVAPAQNRPTELKWGELAPVIAGHQVQIALPDGAVLKGEAVTVRDDALVMDVKKTSNADAHPKGNATLPRESVTLIQVNRNGGSWGRGLGTTVGVIAGVTLGGYTAATTTNSAGAGVATFTGIASAGAIGGYFAGKEASKKTTFIKVVP